MRLGMLMMTGLCLESSQVHMAVGRPEAEHPEHLAQLSCYLWLLEISSAGGKVLGLSRAAKCKRKGLHYV